MKILRTTLRSTWLRCVHRPRALSDSDTARSVVFQSRVCLTNQENGKDGHVIRRLQEFESPYISMERVDKSQHKFMVRMMSRLLPRSELPLPYQDIHHCCVTCEVRRAYWHESGDKELFKDEMAVNMLYVQVGIVAPVY